MGTPGLEEAHFLFTGAQQDWTVPGGVTQVAVVIAGGNQALLGQAIECLLTVTPGEVLHLFVGGEPDAFGDGGWNGGGAGSVLFTGLLGLDWTSSAGYGASDIRRGGITLADRILVAGGGTGISWDNRTPPPGFGVGDAGEVDALYGYSIRSTMPGPGDAPRVVRTPFPEVGTTYTLTLPGNPGGDAVGGAAVSGSGFSIGAGGGGAGGGASGASYTVHSTDPDVDGTERWAGGNTGGWFAAPGITATLGARLRGYGFTPGDTYGGGGIRFEWMLAGSQGWNVGHLAGGGLP